MWKGNMLMVERRMSISVIGEYERELVCAEKAPRTVLQYRRAVQRFYLWLPQDKAVTREAALAYKAILQQQQKATSVNTTLAALNSFFQFLGWTELLMKPLKTQRKIFCDEDRELAYQDYLKLVETAEAASKPRLSLILQTIACTGIRVSELRAITVESIQKQCAVVFCKGKIRTILLPGKLCRKLQKYARRNGLYSGPVFVTRSGEPLDRGNIWADMKKLCGKAGVDPHKVFPHNLRHLFARRYYEQHRDLSKLADILGHSSINTTRIYIITSAREHAVQIEELGLVI